MSALLHETGKWTTCRDENDTKFFYDCNIESAKIAEVVLKRFKYSKYFIQKVVLIIRNSLYPKMLYSGIWTDVAVRKFAKRCGNELESIIEVSRTNFDKDNIKIFEELLSKIEKLKLKKMLYVKPDLIVGKELMMIFNRPQGKWIQVVKDKIEEMQIEDPNITKEDVIENIKKLNNFN